MLAKEGKKLVRRKCNESRRGGQNALSTHPAPKEWYLKTCVSKRRVVGIISSQSHDCSKSKMKGKDEELWNLLCEAALDSAVTVARGGKVWLRGTPFEGLVQESLSQICVRQVRRRGSD